MTATRTSISAFPRGHVFPPLTFTPGPESIAAYLRAVGDGGDYGGAVPPLAAVALGLSALQEHIELPHGALHTGQELESLAPVASGDELTLAARVAQRSERAGFVISVIELEIAPGSARAAIRARTTIMAPAAGA